MPHFQDGASQRMGTGYRRHACVPPEWVLYICPKRVRVIDICTWSARLWVRSVEVAPASKTTDPMLQQGRVGLLVVVAYGIVYRFRC